MKGGRGEEEKDERRVERDRGRGERGGFEGRSCASSAAPVCRCRCNDLENSASGANVSKSASCGARRNTPRSFIRAHAWIFMKTIVGAPTARNSWRQSAWHERGPRSTNALERYYFSRHFSHRWSPHDQPGEIRSREQPISFYRRNRFSYRPLSRNLLTTRKRNVFSRVSLFFFRFFPRSRNFVVKLHHLQLCCLKRVLKISRKDGSGSKVERNVN